MNIRIGALVISVNFIFLLFAGAYFLVISLRHLYPGVIGSRSRAAGALAVVSGGGVIGGLLYGMIAGGAAAQQAGLPPSLMEFNFGSFGGYWGVLAGATLYGMLIRTSPLLLMDAVIPGILAGGIIARAADFFTGSSSGISLHIAGLPWLQPFRHWFGYDIAALFVVLVLVWRMPGKGKTAGIGTVWFLAGYGVLRFVIEFARDTARPYGWMTWGQCMAVIQIIGGIVLFAALKRKTRV